MLYLSNAARSADLLEHLPDIGSSCGLSISTFIYDSESKEDLRVGLKKVIDQISQRKPDSARNIYPAKSTIILVLGLSTKDDLKLLVESETDKFPILDSVIEFKYSANVDEEGTPNISLSNAPAVHVEEESTISADEMVERTDQNHDDRAQGKLCPNKKYSQFLSY